MQQIKTHWLSLCLFALGFLLLWEWLRPLTVIADIGHVNEFVGFALFSFLLTYLRWPFWLTFSLKFLAILFVLHRLFFYHTSLFNWLWVDYFINDIHKNLSFISQGNWVDFTGLFKSFLFLILLWIVSYLMRYWLLQTRRLFLFFFVTVIYLAILDSFTVYHVEFAIVRTMIIGFILLGILRLLKIQESEKVSFEKSRFPLAWFVPLFSLIALTVFVGFVAPKFDSRWPDPVPFIQKVTSHSNYTEGQGADSGVQTIGYDDNDTHLGGSFLMDNTPVFYAEERVTHYWRISTKDVYTGKGWVNQPLGQVKSIDSDHLDRSPVLALYEQNTKTQSERDKVNIVYPNFPQLTYGGEVNAITKMSQKRASLQINSSTEKLEPTYRGRHITIRKYAVSYQYPRFAVNKLRAITSNRDDPREVRKHYLQLPTELPKRVKKLAIKLTKHETNRYDKVQALLTYLQSSRFAYQIDGVPIPSGRTDYVDQFLFDTHFGYCDNFSTAMAVLLRASGIPTRWVKGFTPGTYDKSIDTTYDKYVVKNSDAHSWVEVYFPNSGWVPFEATKSFDNPYSFHNDNTDVNNSEAAVANAQNHMTNPNQDKENTQQQQLHDAQQQDQASQSLGTKAKGSSLILWIVFGVILLILIIAFIVLYRMRKKWLPHYLLRRYRSRTDEAAFDEAFKHLLKLLSMHGYTLKSDQTLREFALKVDHALGIRDMAKLVKHYEEKQYYHASSERWLESKESWETIVGKLSVYHPF